MANKLSTDTLPKGWVMTTLGEVCLPVENIRPQATPLNSFTYFDIGGVDNKHNRIVTTKATTGRMAPGRARQAVRKGDILFSTVRTYLKNIACIEEDYPNPVASTGFAVIRAADGVIPRFLLYQVLSDLFLEPVHLLQSGSSYPAVRARDVFAQPLLLPPSAEQERIAVKLDASLSAVERAETATRRAIERLRHYRSAVLIAAVTGELTRDWREARQNAGQASMDSGETVLRHLLTVRRADWETNELRRLRAVGKKPKDDRWKARYPEPTQPSTADLPALPVTWVWASLEMIAQVGSGISVSKNRLVKNPVELPYLRVANVMRGYLDLSEVKTIRVEKDQVPSYLLQANDILFTEGGDRDKLGRGWVWEGQIRKCVHQNHVFRARLFDSSFMNSKLVSYWGNTGGQQFFINHGTQTTNLASINRGVLGKLPVPIAPVEEQAEISREVERRLKAAEALTAKLETQLSRANDSRQSLLRDAFAGRLVPQNRADEPASALLERIHVIRLIESQQQRGTPMTKHKSVIERRPLIDVLVEHKKPMTPEDLFLAAGHTQESVDQFFAELRELTATPVKVAEQRKSGRTYLRALP